MILIYKKVQIKALKNQGYSKAEIKKMTSDKSKTGKALLQFALMQNDPKDRDMIRTNFF